MIPAQVHGISSQLQEVKATKEQVVEAPAATASANAPVAAAPVIRHATSYHDEILRTGKCFSFKIKAISLLPQALTAARK